MMGVRSILWGDFLRLRFVPLDTLVRESLPSRNGPAVVDAFNRTGIALIHIPKNAGSSVEQALYGMKIGHRTWAETRALAPEQFDKWHKIAVVRDPIDRFVSAFRYLSTGGRNAHDHEFSRRFVRGKDINDFVASLSPQAMRWFHFRPQSEFVTADGKLKIDELIQLPSVGERLSQLIDTPLPHLNASTQRRAGQLSSASLERLRNVYAEDFELYQRA
jgi:hypothetical protein